MFLIDTNIVSELRKVGSGRADVNVCSWFKSIEKTYLYLSVITVFELELGILRLERKDPIQAGLLRTWMDAQVIPYFDRHILPIDTTIVRRCARLHTPNPKAQSDSFIAATALVHGFAVVTRNVQDFQETGVKLINPFEPIN